jgi:hypothetical protein
MGRLFFELPENPLRAAFDNIVKGRELRRRWKRAAPMRRYDLSFDAG